VATVPGGLLLHPAAHVVDAAQAQPHHMEGIEHPGRGGQLGGQRPGIPAERVQGGGADPLAPLWFAVGELVGQHGPGVRSVIPVANSVGCSPVAARNAVSSTPTASTPTASTPASQAGSSTSALLRSMTILVIVHQATRAAGRPRRRRRHGVRPAHRPRPGPARSSTAVARPPDGSVQVRLGHHGCGQLQTRFPQQITTGHPRSADTAPTPAGDPSTAPPRHTSGSPPDQP